MNNVSEQQKRKNDIRLTLGLNPQPEDCEESALTITLRRFFSLSSQPKTNIHSIHICVKVTQTVHHSVHSKF